MIRNIEPALRPWVMRRPSCVWNNGIIKLNSRFLGFEPEWFRADNGSRFRPVKILFMNNVGAQRDCIVRKMGF
jgi:hypothetical protein